MSDTFTKAQRSEIMRSVRSRGTGAENTCESLLRSLKLKFSQHPSDLAGKPDFLLKKFGLAIFVHGCFWHGHECARGARAPKANAEYWRAKIGGNSVRDAAHIRELKKAGWRAAVIWECELKKLAGLERRLARFLGK